MFFQGKDPGCVLGRFRPRYKTKRKRIARRGFEKWSNDIFDSQEKLSKAEFAIALILSDGGDWEEYRRAQGQAEYRDPKARWCSHYVYLRRIMPHKSTLPVPWNPKLPQEQWPGPWYGAYVKYPPPWHSWQFWPPPGESARVNASAFLYNQENEVNWVRSSKGRFTYYEGDNDTTADPADTFREAEDEEDPHCAAARGAAKHHPAWKATHELVRFQRPGADIFFGEWPDEGLYLDIGEHETVVCAIHHQFFHCCPAEKAAMQQVATFRHIHGRAQLIEKRIELENEISLYRRIAKTHREAKIVDLAAQGLGPKAIGQRLNIERTTVWRQLREMAEKVREPLATERAKLAARIKEIDGELASGVPAFLNLLDDADAAHAITAKILGHYGEPTEEDHRALLAALRVAAENPGKDVQVQGSR
jgi:predicted DNA-binding protein (UPF0251 family)